MLEKAQFQNLTTVPNAIWKFSSGINVIVGENGLGKSHVLKAIYSMLKASEFMQILGAVPEAVSDYGA